MIGLIATCAVVCLELCELLTADLKESGGRSLRHAFPGSHWVSLASYLDHLIASQCRFNIVQLLVSIRT